MTRKYLTYTAVVFGMLAVSCNSKYEQKACVLPPDNTVTDIQLSECEGVDFGRISEFRNLKYLTLIRVRGAKNISNSFAIRSLEELSIINSPSLTNIGVVAVRLKNLHISEPDPMIMKKTIDGFSTLTKITIKNVETDDISYICKSPSIEEVVIQHSKITSIERGISCLKSLKKVTIYASDIGSQVQNRNGVSIERLGSYIPLEN